MMCTWPTWVRAGVSRTGFWTGERDAGAHALGMAIAGERNERVVLLGDMKGTMDDRAFDDITSQMRSAQDAAGDGLRLRLTGEAPDGEGRPDAGQRSGAR